MQKQPETTRKLIGKRKPTGCISPSRIVGNNKTSTDKADICAHFNQYFINVGPQLESTIPQNNENPMEYIKKTPSYHGFVVSSHRTTSMQTLLKFGFAESIIRYSK